MAHHVKPVVEVFISSEGEEGQAAIDSNNLLKAFDQWIRKQKIRTVSTLKATALTYHVLHRSEDYHPIRAFMNENAIHPLQHRLGAACTKCGSEIGHHLIGADNVLRCPRETEAEHGTFVVEMAPGDLCGGSKITREMKACPGCRACT